MAATVRLAVVGLGTVGEWLLRAIERDREALRKRYGFELQLTAVGRRQGFVGAERGIEIADALELKHAGRPLADLEGVRAWPDAVSGLEDLEIDLLAEVSQSPMSDGEPGLSHMRTALARGAGVATSNKWPVALHGVELAAAAREAGVGFRAESTVMSGTPVLAALTQGLAGARPLRLRGALNATTNFVCTRLNQRVGYDEALAEAQAAGLAEPDPGEDVDGLDSVAKVLVLSALVFETRLGREQVAVRGVSALSREEIEAALERGERLREVSTLDPDAGVASVDATAVAPDDPLFGVDGSTNHVRVEAEPLGELAIRGPGAGPEMAGLGVFSDLIALARDLVARRAG